MSAEDNAHKTLVEALLAFQAEAPSLPKDGRNPHFNSRFTKLDTIREKIGPLLVKHGLTWQTFPCFGPNGEPALRYTLTHVSGDSQSDVMPLMMAKSDPQGQGSAVTYGRRYSVTAVLDLIADEDDDGNKATEGAQAQNGHAQPSAAPVQQTERPASARQRGLLNVRASEAELCPTDFANVVLKASGQEMREFESEEHAGQWLKRALDRLPAYLVNPVLEQIAALKDTGVPS